MKQKISLLVMLCMMAGAGAYAQAEKADKEERAEKRAESAAKTKEKVEYTVFHRQMLALKEFSDARRKIPALQKANKTTVKILAVVDSNDNDAESKTIQGFIVQNAGDNSVNLYEVTYDRAQKKIISVKQTKEAADADKEDKADEDEKKEDTKKASVHKKAKDEDEDDDDDKPVKGKEKEKDKDDDKD